MPTTARILNLFVASASDVSEERDAVEGVVARINQKLGSLGWIVRPIRWEYSRRGLGAPQNRINPDVDACDLLVGIVYRRWGAPTEEYSSGFEEEFERVRTRRDCGEDADAVLFVRELRAGDKPDPGLAEFRERARSIALLHKYAHVEQFSSLLFEHLAHELALRSKADRAQATKEPAALSPGPEPSRQLAVPRPNDRDRSEALGQASTALREIGALAAGDTEVAEDEAIARAHLAATALLAKRVNGVTLGVHEINNVYLYRESLRLSTSEQFLVGRTMCEFGFLAPGWRALQPDVTAEDLLSLLITDTSTAVRTGALKELGAAGIAAGVRDAAERKDGLDLVDIWLYLANEDDDAVRSAVAEALPQSGLPDVDVLLALIAASGSAEANTLLVERLVSSDPTAACELIADSPTSLGGDLEEQLLARASDVTAVGLESLEAAGVQGTRLAWRLRARSGRLKLETMVRLLNSDKAGVRRAALEALIDAGVPLPLQLFASTFERDKDSFPFDSRNRSALALRALSLHPVDDLLDHVSWLDSESGLALHAAARRDDGHAALERARRILSGGLPDERAAAIEREAARSTNPETGRAEALRIAERFHDFLDSQLCVHALNALAVQPDVSSDAALARRFAVEEDDTFTLRASARILSACAHKRDLGLLVGMLDRVVEHDLRQTLLEGSLRAAGNNVDRVLDLVGSTSESPERHIPTILRHAAASRLPVAEERLLKLLDDEHDEVRVAAVACLVEIQTREQLEATLQSYANRGGYRYYNVVGILDRVLYAPEAVAAQTRARISS